MVPMDQPINALAMITAFTRNKDIAEASATAARGAPSLQRLFDNLAVAPPRRSPTLGEAQQLRQHVVRAATSAKEAKHPSFEPGQEFVA